MSIRNLFYLAKPLIPRKVQIALRRKMVQRKRLKHLSNWPIFDLPPAPPPDWNGWPEQKKFALVLTHDVEKEKGQMRTEALMKMEQAHGFVSSFNYVPERYKDTPAIRHMLTDAGFEVGVHGLNHDGKLYRSRAEFLRRAKRINDYIKQWNAVGFRSPAMHHNLDWIRDLNIEYDASTFDTDPFEPQPDGVGTIFPFVVADEGNRKGYVELPYTLPQDFTLFVLLGEQDNRIWREKLDWIAENGGMALINVHPDYMHFGPGTPAIDEYKAALYDDFLNYVRTRYEGQYWHALPRDIATFWRAQAAASSAHHHTASNLQDAS